MSAAAAIDTAGTDPFDYAAPAELYFILRRKPAGKMMGPWRGITYRRFPSAASAIRFLMEDISPDAVVSATIEVAQGRFEKDGIGHLYRAGAYPLDRVAHAR